MDKVFKKLITTIFSFKSQVLQQTLNFLFILVTTQTHINAHIFCLLKVK